MSQALSRVPMGIDSFNHLISDIFIIPHFKYKESGQRNWVIFPISCLNITEPEQKFRHPDFMAQVLYHSIPLPKYGLHRFQELPISHKLKTSLPIKAFRGLLSVIPHLLLFCSQPFPLYWSLFLCAELLHVDSTILKKIFLPSLPHFQVPSIRDQDADSGCSPCSGGGCCSKTFPWRELRDESLYGTSGKEPSCQPKTCKRHRFDPWVGKICWSRKWHPTPVFLPGKFHAKRSLLCYSPWGHKELDMT